MSTLFQASYCISALIFNLIDRSLSTGVVPQNLKTAVSPLLRNLAQFLPYLLTTGLFLISYLLRFWKKYLFHDCNLIQNLIISMNHFNQVFLHFTAPRLHCSWWSLTSFYLLNLGFLSFLYYSISTLLLILSFTKFSLSVVLPLAFKKCTFLVHLVPFG